MAIDLFVKVQLQRSLTNYTRGDINGSINKRNPNISIFIYRHFSNVSNSSTNFFIRQLALAKQQMTYKDRAAILLHHNWYSSLQYWLPRRVGVTWHSNVNWGVAPGNNYSYSNASLIKHYTRSNWSSYFSYILHVYGIYYYTVVH